MWLKKVDWLSPSITLYYKGEGLHVSMYSGLLAIFAYTIVVVSTFYYALNFINREDQKAYFFNRYIEDVGNFPVNATQMFHFVQLSDPQTNLKVQKISLYLELLDLMMLILTTIKKIQV